MGLGFEAVYIRMYVLLCITITILLYHKYIFQVLYFFVFWSFDKYHVIHVIHVHMQFPLLLYTQSMSLYCLKLSQSEFDIFKFIFNTTIKQHVIFNIKTTKSFQIKLIKTMGILNYAFPNWLIENKTQDNRFFFIQFGFYSI